MSKPAIFKVGGALVNAQGQPVNEDGRVIGTPSAPVAGDDVRVRELEAELAEAKASALPANARERLIAVKGVGEKLADEILAVLKAE